MYLLKYFLIFNLFSTLFAYKIGICKWVTSQNKQEENEFFESLILNQNINFILKKRKKRDNGALGEKEEKSEVEKIKKTKLYEFKSAIDGLFVCNCYDNILNYVFRREGLV